MFLKQTMETIFSNNLSSCRRMFYKRKDERKVCRVFFVYADTMLRLYAGVRGKIPAVVFSQELDINIKTYFVTFQEVD